MKTLRFKTTVKCNGCLNAVTPFLNQEGLIKKLVWWTFCGMCGIILSLIGYGATALWNYHILAQTVSVHAEKIYKIEAGYLERDKFHDSRFERHRDMLDDHEKRIGDLEVVS